MPIMIYDLYPPFLYGWVEGSKKCPEAATLKTYQVGCINKGSSPSWGKFISSFFLSSWVKEPKKMPGNCRNSWFCRAGMVVSKGAPNNKETLYPPFSEMSGSCRAGVVVSKGAPHNRETLYPPLPEMSWSCRAGIIVTKGAHEAVELIRYWWVLWLKWGRGLKNIVQANDLQLEKAFLSEVTIQGVAALRW